MAKKSKIAKNEQRKEIVARYAERRAELKRIIKSPHSTDEERMDAQYELNRQPRDASPIRVRNRDAADGRPRGYLRKLVCPVSAFVRWPTVANSRASVSPAGKSRSTNEAQSL